MTAMTRAASNRVANTLGWFSIGLGVCELAGAGRMLGLMGGKRSGIARLYGLREIATGVGLLTASDPTPWVWGRVGGDMLDLGSLAGGFTRRRRSQGNRALALLVVVALGAVDVIAARSIRPRTPLAGI